MERFQAYVDANQNRFLDELKALCAQPSIAAQGIGLEETATLVEERLKGLDEEVVDEEIEVEAWMCEPWI